MGSSTMFRHLGKVFAVGVSTLVLLSLPSHAADVLPHALTIAEMDVVWNQRTDPDQTRELIRIGQELSREQPGNYEAGWRLARAQWWLCHTSRDRRSGESACGRAMDLAKATIELRPERVEARLVFALATRDYGISIGPWRAFAQGIATQFETAALTAYDLDRDFDDGSAIAALGRHYYSLPWPIRDLVASRTYLEELRARHPRALWGRFYLAETYYKLGDRSRARAELDYVLTHQPLAGKEPDDAPAKEAAQQRYGEWFGNRALLADARAH